jgi:Flp pilus assembly protein CpaB
VNTVSRLILRHRRPLAALFAGLAVLLALGALRSEPPSRMVVVAARDLASGTVLTDGDVRQVPMPLSIAPAHSTHLVEDVAGRTVAGPMRRGEVVTDRRVVQADRMDGYPDGTVLATVRLADADALTNLRVGDRIDVVAVGADGGSEAETVARDAEIVTLPRTDDASDGVSIGVATTEDEALRLAQRALDARLSVMATP